MGMGILFQLLFSRFSNSVNIRKLLNIYIFNIDNMRNAKQYLPGDNYFGNIKHEKEIIYRI